MLQDDKSFYLQSKIQVLDIVIVEEEILFREILNPVSEYI